MAKPSATKSSKKSTELSDRIATDHTKQFYDFVGAGPSTEGSKAFSGDSKATSSADWTELTDTNYQKLVQ